jgi:hypothetical protein
MRIRSAIGTGILFIVLALFMPAVLSELAHTIVTFLQSASQAFTAAGQLAASASHQIK